MASCPECKAQISDSATKCPHCGREIIPGEELDKLPGKITGWQKFIIAISVVILVAIGLTYQGAEERENAAAQKNFSEPVADIVQAICDQSGLAQSFGIPEWALKAETKKAEVSINFPRGPLTMEQASVFGRAVCTALARAYVKKGYMPRSLVVFITSTAGPKKKMVYGKAVYNGNLDMLSWEPGL